MALLASARLGAVWLRTHRSTASDADRRQVLLPIVARRQFAMPWQAPHFVDALLASGATGTRRIDTTLDSEIQHATEIEIARHVQAYGDLGIRNVAALVVDPRDMGIKAWVGSADYWDDAIDGQVNGVTAKRSPGSALKPFVYALALDQGVLHPRTMLRDAPTAFGSFTPENFDGRFVGPISAEEALVRSRNVPAVLVSAQLRRPSLYQFLRSAGISDLKPESFYRVGLALGGGEVTMEEIAGGVQRVFRFDDTALIGVHTVSDGPLPWRPATAGIHLVRVVDDHGRSAERQVEVVFTR